MKVTGPNNITIEFPEGTDPATIDRVMREAMQATQPASVEDVSKSAGAGLVTGLSGLAGLEGDVSRMAGAGVDWVKGKMGMDTSRPTQVPLTPQAMLKGALTGTGYEDYIPGAPTSQQVRSAVEENVTGPLYEPKSTMGKYARTAGEFLPAAAAGPGSFGRRVVQQALVPSIASETAGQATEGTKAEPYARFAGGIAGAAAPGLARRVITPLPQDPGRAKMVNILRKEGVEPTAGQVTGRKRLQYAEAELGGAGTAGMLEQQGDQFTAAVLRRVGEQGTRATTDVVDRAFSRIGGDFDRIAQNNSMRPDNKMLQDLSATWRDYTGLVPESQRAPAVAELMTDIVGRARVGPIPGRVYQTYRSRLDRMARNARSDPQLSGALADLRDTLDDAMERSMTAAGRKGDIADWKKARRQYRNLIVVEKALAGGGEDAGLGIITPARLRMAAASGSGRRGFIRGKSDFSDLALAGQSIMTPLPNSGTPARMAMYGLPAAIGSAVGGGTGGGPGAMLGAIGGMVAPAAVGRGLMSKPVQKYLKNNKAPPPAPNSEAAQRAALMALVYGPRTLGPPQQ